MIEVLQPGLFTSVQDIGRIGFAGFGVPQSGVMDHYTARFGNLILGNSNKNAVLEITLIGPTLRFHSDALAVVSGQDADIHLDNIPIPVNEAFEIRKNSILEIKLVRTGNYVYLAVLGGFQTGEIMGSRSMYEGITQRATIQKGEFLPISSIPQNKQNDTSSVRFDKNRYATEMVQVFPGPEFEWLPQNSKQNLLGENFTLSADSSRIAFLFEETLPNKMIPILTGPVLPGTVQLTPGGNLIVLMRDSPTTGGYPRVLQVSEKSLDILAQKRARDRISFQFI